MQPTKYSSVGIRVSIRIGVGIEVRVRDSVGMQVSEYWSIVIRVIGRARVKNSVRM